ncbi:homoprotocatechuate degradation operon regulator HpaR [Paramagnetospirillum magnetotacticum]|uniref:homoprotocatechuate degradation operon regulator HpaR n=1 Tax=Paramagnetospirillum magnetotacticum TaxID=188 RepID=UPI001364C3BD|nr:homoprotocatechuate degradation operon regulator HpaR [Paramagnetospirillum magnetotacticum]
MSAKQSSSPDELTRLRAITRSLPLALLKAREDVMAGFRPNLRSHDITEQQWRALKSLAQTGEMRAGQLSRASLISMPSLTRIIRTLEKQGLIERRPEERDQRAALLSLTEKGHELVLSVSHAAEKRYDEIVAAFGLDRLERLHLMLEELSEALTR